MVEKSYGGIEPPPQVNTDPMMAHIIYGLFVLGLATGGVASFIGMILAYSQRAAVRSTWLETHYTWQIVTFWWSVLWTVVGFILTFIFIGWIVWAIAFFWFLYRVVKGWSQLGQGKPVY
jgi:uncharacterized membrane protein